MLHFKRTQSTERKITVDGNKLSPFYRSTASRQLVLVAVLPGKKGETVAPLQIEKRRIQRTGSIGVVTARRALLPL